MIRIERDEHRGRIDRLRSEVDEAGLDLFLVTSLESIYYLTGAGFEPLERPFYLLIGPGAGRSPILLVPRLDGEHMGKARDILGEIQTYREYPAPEGRRWSDRLRTLIGPARYIGVEPSLRLEVADELRDLSTRVAPLVERLRPGPHRPESAGAGPQGRAASWHADSRSLTSTPSLLGSELDRVGVDRRGVRP